MSYAVSLSTPLVRNLSSPARSPSSAETQHLSVLLQQVKSSNPAQAKKTMISRKDYPSIVKLKLAGNTNKSIAKKLGVQVEQLKLHVNKALSAYRNGRILVDAGETVKEARKSGAEKSTAVAETASPPLLLSSFSSELATVA